MTILSVLYPKDENSRFDYAYYTAKHIPLVYSLLGDYGLERVDLLQGMAALDGGLPPFELIGHLVFTSADQMQAGLAATGSQVIGDIVNFTNVHPIVQFTTPISA